MRRAHNLVVAGTLLLGGAAWLHHATRLTTTEQHVTTSMQMRWPVGERALFGVVWQSSTRGFAVQGQPAVDAKANFEGDIALEAVSARGGDTEVALSIVSIAAIDASIGGRAANDLAATRDALVGKHAFLTVSSRGEIKQVRYEAGTTSTAQAALRGLAVQLHFVLPAGDQATWESTEPVPMGEMQQRYTRDGERLVRHAVAFKRLEGRPEQLDGAHGLHGEAVIDVRGGRLTAIDDSEQWTYTPKGDATPFVTTAFSFKLVRKNIGFADLAALSAIPVGEGVAIDAPPVDGDLAHRRDGRLATGVSESTILALIDAQVHGAKFDGQAAVKAAAYLRLHPEATKALVKKFQEKQIGIRGRGFILDLLTQAGDAPAQTAMRDALASVQLVPAERGLMVQRFSFVSSPTPESVRFVEDEYTRAKTTSARGTAQGAATALGALTQHLDQSGNAALANEANARLQSELRTTQDPALLAAIVAGLGNAKRHENVPLIAQAASHEDIRVRSYAAQALRNVDAPDARKALLALTIDKDSTVSSTAFSSLQSQTLGQDEWHDLAARVTSGQTNPDADASLVGLLRVRKDQAGDDATAMLRVLAERNTGGDNDLSTMIRDLMVGS